VSQMAREGHWAKSLEVYESLDAVAVRPDTTITNAAISACDKGGQWEKALQIFK
jgi:pentatricopeptide repeat domain-containing protein 1